MRRRLLFFFRVSKNTREIRCCIITSGCCIKAMGLLDEAAVHFTRVIELESEGSERKERAREALLRVAVMRQSTPHGEHFETSMV